MTIAQIISLLVIALVILSLFRPGRDLLSPSRIFLLLWSFVIILTEFKFSKLQQEWDNFGWFTLIISLFTFLTGLYIAYIVFLDKPLLTIEELRNRSKRTDERDLNNLFIITNILFVLYLICFALEVIIEGTVPLFSPRLDIARKEFGIFGLHLIVNFQLIIMFLNIEYIVLAPKRFLQNKIVMWVIFFVTLISFTLLLQRFNYFFGAVMTLGLLYYCTRIIKFKWIAAMALGFFVFLGVIQSIRLSQYVSQYIYVVSKMKYSRAYAIFTEPYMYISMNLENAARATTKLENFSFSTSTFDWVYALVGLKHWMNDYFNLTARPFLISGYNTYPFYWSYFYDFGLLGITFFPLITGILIGVSYYKMRRTGNLKWVSLYAICLAIIVISFFTNPLTMLAFVANFLMLWVIHHFFMTNTIHVSPNE